MRVTCTRYIIMDLKLLATDADSLQLVLIQTPLVLKASDVLLQLTDDPHEVLSLLVCRHLLRSQAVQLLFKPLYMCVCGGGGKS